MRSITLLLFVLFTSLTYGQGHSNQLKGEFKLASSANLPVEFVLNWTEENGKINGDYKDNHFAKYAKVSGSSDDLGRYFNVTLPQMNKGVLSISVLSSNIKPEKTGLKISLSVVTRDENGSPLNTTEASGEYVRRSVPASLLVQREEEVEVQKCVARMGELAGFCGDYGGLMAEEVDASNSCNLLLAEDITLNLDSERNIKLFLSSTGPLLNPPHHILGRLPPDPRRRIDVSVRNCKALSGVIFGKNPQSCKKINLSGSFLMNGDNRLFVGNYTIFDEKGRNFCRYNFSFKRDRT